MSNQESITTANTVRLTSGSGARKELHINDEHIHGVTKVEIRCEANKLDTVKVNLLAPVIEYDGIAQLILNPNTIATLRQFGWTHGTDTDIGKD